MSELAKQIIVLCDQIDRSKCAMGYDDNLLQHLGRLVFANGGLIATCVRESGLAAQRYAEIEQQREVIRDAFSQINKLHTKLERALQPHFKPSITFVSRLQMTDEEIAAFALLDAAIEKATGSH
jgi:hypothetical protein